MTSIWEEIGYRMGDVSTRGTRTNLRHPLTYVFLLKHGCELKVVKSCLVMAEETVAHPTDKEKYKEAPVPNHNRNLVGSTALTIAEAYCSGVIYAFSEIGDAEVEPTLLSCEQCSPEEAINVHGIELNGSCKVTKRAFLHSQVF